MFLNVRDMELRPLRISRKFEIGEIDFLDTSFRQTTPLEVEATAELKPVLDEIRLKGHLSISMELECDRCLTSYPWPIEADFDLLYAPTGEQELPEDAGLKDEEAEMAFYQGAGLELEDVLREQVLLALPMQRVCREDCAGLCPTCGENWNDRECDCQPVIEDPRWSALQDLKLKNK
jgi:uncharacterized protein